MDLSVENTLDFKSLHLPQKIAMKGVMRGENGLILGGGGVGKSHLIKILQRHIPGIVTVATSGIASVNINSITLDSYLGLRPGYDGLIAFSDMSPEHQQAIRQISCLLIDEASFLRIDKFERIDERLRKITGIDSPFGGIQIILVGDFCQLPPVVGRKEERDFRRRYGQKLYCFESPLYAAGDFTPYVLDTYARQEDKEEQDILKRIRLNRNIPLCIKKLQTKTHPTPFETGVSLYPTNKLVDKENQQKTEKISGKATQYLAEYEGDMPHEEKTLPHELILKPSLRVMTTMNKPDEGYANGDLGTIKRCLKDRVILQLDRGEEVEVKRAMREVTEQQWEGDQLKEKVVASMSQIPLKIAYALTIHKSQGLTLDHVNLTLDRNGYFPFLGYVGTSRTRHLNHIHLRHPLSTRCFTVNQRAIDFTLSESQKAMARREQDIQSFNLAI